MLTSVDILGVRVHSGAVGNVIEHIDQRMLAQDTTRVAFLNANLSNICSKNADMRAALDGFVVLNDGVGLDIARRVLHGQAFPENLNGTDFVTNYLDRTKHDLRIFLLGARDDVVSKACDAVRSRWTRHQVVGHHHGFLSEVEEGDLLETIAATRPDLLLVGMGNPLQERWIAAHVPGACDNAMAVGAWFDFIAGVVPRAPGWVRSARLEWLFRLCIEPRRLAQRYLVGNPVFLLRLCFAKLRLNAIEHH